MSAIWMLEYVRGREFSCELSMSLISQVQFYFEQTIELVRRWCKGRQLDTVNIWMMRRVFRIWRYALDDWLSRWALHSPASPYRSFFIRKEQGVVCLFIHTYIRVRIKRVNQKSKVKSLLSVRCGSHNWWCLFY